MLDSPMSCDLRTTYRTMAAADSCLLILTVLCFGLNSATNDSRLTLQLLQIVSLLLSYFLFLCNIFLYFIFLAFLSCFVSDFITHLASQFSGSADSAESQYTIIHWYNYTGITISGN